MNDIRAIFSEQEQRVYEKLPLATVFYLHKKTEIEVILVSDKFCEIYNVERKNVLGKFDHNKYVQVHEEDRDKIELATQKFDKGEIEKFDVTCRVFNKEEDRYVWHHASGAFLDLDNDARVAMINFENIDQQIEQSKVQASLNLKNEKEYNEVQNIFNALIQEQSEYIIRMDEDEEKVIMIAAKNNFFGFKEGYSELTFKEYEDVLKNEINVVNSYGGKRLGGCREYLDYVEDKTNVTNYTVEKNGEIYYKTALSFRGNQDYQLYCIVNDATCIVKKEYFRAEELKKANDAKSDFLSRMSHDMRTPLGAVIATANFGIDEINDKQAKEYFEEIRNSANYLLAIMNDVLDVQKLSYNKVKLNSELFELNKLNNIVRDIVLKNYNKNSINIIFKDEYPESLKYVKFDKQRLEQVLINLLNNAIKYTSKGGTVQGICTLEEDNEVKYLKYIVQDDGIGMSEKFQKKMFEPFAREENEYSNLKEGTGLGLSIVKKIIDTANGKIECKSKLGVGTTFTVKIPIQEISENEIKLFEEKNKRNEINLKEKNFQGKKILLVEDIEINRKIARKILTNMGLNVTLVVNGQEAVDNINKNSYDLVLMDVRMPVLDGHQATAKIRTFDQKTPIIGLSANAFVEDINKSLALGMNDYLAKPIDKNKLLKILSKYC